MNITMRRRLRMTGAAVAASVVVAIGLTACASGGATPGGASTDSNSVEGATIGISYPYVNNSFYQTLTKSLTSEAEAAGFKPLPVTDAGSDSSKQISDIQTLISRGAKGLIVEAQNSDVLAGAVEAAVTKGIPVVSPDIGIDSPAVYVNVRVSSTAMAELQCDAVGKALDGKGRIYYQAGDLSGQAGSERWNGFNDCISENYPAMQIVMKESKWDANTATNQLETTLSADSNFQAIILASDSVYTNGTIAVLKKLNLLKPVGEAGHIYIASIDGSPEGVTAVRDGNFDASVSQPLFDYAKYSIAYLKAAMEGKEIKAGPTDHDSEIIDNDGVLTDVLPAFLVTIDNINDPNIWGNS
jgi:ribose transport system substrate-binding protein